MANLRVDGLARVGDGDVLEHLHLAGVAVHVDLGGAPSHFPERRPGAQRGLGDAFAHLPALTGDDAARALDVLHQHREGEGDLPQPDLAVGDGHGGAGALPHGAGGLDELVPDGPGGLLHREPHDRGGAAGVGAHVEGSRVGVQGRHLDGRGPHAELLRGDASQGGVGALTDLDGALVQGDPAAVVHLHPRGRDLEVAAAVLAAATDADAAVRFQLLPPADLPGGPQEPLLQVGVHGGFPGGELLTLVQEVLEPELHRIPAHLPGDDVHLRLVGPRHLGRAHAAERAGRHRVGVYGVGVGAEVRDAVGAGSPVAGLLGDPGARVRVGAAVHVHEAVPGHELAVPVHAGAEPDAGGRLAHRARLLFQRQVQEHPPPGLAGQGQRHGLELGVVLVAVGASHQRHHHPRLLPRHAEHLGQFVADDELVLGRTPQREPVVAPLGHGELRLHGEVGDLGEVEGVLEDPFRGSEPRVDVALGALVVKAHVGVLLGLVVDAGISREARSVVAHRLVEGRGIGMERLVHGHQRGQRLVLHIDEREGGGGRLQGLGCHRGHRVAVVADLVDGQHGRVLHQRAVVLLDVLEVRGREHRHDPGMGLGRRRVDAEDAGVGVGAAQDPGVEHARVGQVGGVDRLAADLGGAVEPALVEGPRGWRILTAPQRGGPMDRPDDGEVAGATADVAVQRRLDVFFRGVRILVQQGAGGEDHARGAEAALEAAFLPERLLHRVQRVVAAEALDGRQRASVDLVGEGRAGAHRTAVQQHGAGAADLHLAARLGAPEVQGLAQEVHQQQLRRHAGATRLAVQLELNLDLVHGVPRWGWRARSRGGFVHL